MTLLSIICINHNRLTHKKVHSSQDLNYHQPYINYTRLFFEYHSNISRKTATFMITMYFSEKHHPFKFHCFFFVDMKGRSFLFNTFSANVYVKYWLTWYFCFDFICVLYDVNAVVLFVIHWIANIVSWLYQAIMQKSVV